MGCYHSKKTRNPPSYEDPDLLASQTPFTVEEVEALYELYKKISTSIFNDGLIHKEEFQLALFRNRNKKNLFADRIFDIFDYKRNGVIGFEEFVRSLGTFHPNAPIADKISFTFRLYDLRHTGYIEKDDLKEMVVEILHESKLSFWEADAKGDGRIDRDEWGDFVSINPSLLKYMTLPYLKDLGQVFPSFEVHSEVED
ncbi:hypothetical protein ABFX02_06G101500 [Erythranthe guttata]